MPYIRIPDRKLYQLVLYSWKLHFWLLPLSLISSGKRGGVHTVMSWLVLQAGDWSGCLWEDPHCLDWQAGGGRPQGQARQGGSQDLKVDLLKTSRTRWTRWICSTWTRKSRPSPFSSTAEDHPRLCPILRLTFSESFWFFGFYEIFRIFGPIFDLTSLQDPCVFYKSGEVVEVEGAAVEEQG